MQALAHRFFDRPTLKLVSTRSWSALILLLVFVWGQLALLPTVMMRMASMSGEHQLMILEQKLVLHHLASPKATHHGFTPWIVALSHTDAAGDHVLPLHAPDRCGESREKGILDEAKDVVFESCDVARTVHVPRLPLAVHEFTTDQHRAAEMAIAHWTSIRLLI